MRGGSQMSGGFGGFDDRWGPTVLTGALVAAVVVNFVLRVVGTEETKEGAHRGLKGARMGMGREQSIL